MHELISIEDARYSCSILSP